MVRSVHELARDTKYLCVCVCARAHVRAGGRARAMWARLKLFFFLLGKLCIKLQKTSNERCRPTFTFWIKFHGKTGYNRKYDSYPARQQISKYPTTTHLVLQNEFLTTANFKITVFWDVPCCLVERQQNSAGTRCLHVEGRKIFHNIPDSIHTIISAFLLGFYSCNLHCTNFFFFQ